MDSWTALFFRKAGGPSRVEDNKDKPTLNGWLLTASIGEDTQRVVAVRNPYCWDAEEGQPGDAAWS